MSKIIVFLLLMTSVPLTSSFTAVHKFYVSVTQVEYNNEKNSLQVITSIFIDDIEDLIHERYDASVILGVDKEDPHVNKYLETYLRKKLTFVVNQKEVSFTYLGKEYEDDLIICYLEIENITSLETIKITNQVLMDLFEEQQNIVHVKKGNKRKSLILEKEREIGMLKFGK